MEVKLKMKIVKRKEKMKYVRYAVITWNWQFKCHVIRGIYFIRNAFNSGYKSTENAHFVKLKLFELSFKLNLKS